MEAEALVWHREGYGARIVVNEKPPRSWGHPHLQEAVARGIEKRALEALSESATPGRWYTLPVAEFAAAYDVQKSTMSRWLKKWVENGFMETKRSGRSLQFKLRTTAD